MLMLPSASPMSHDGQCIVLSGLFAWLHRHSLFIECFCGLISSLPVPTHFVQDSETHRTSVHCHYHRNRCGFYRTSLSFLLDIVLTFRS